MDPGGELRQERMGLVMMGADNDGPNKGQPGKERLDKKRPYTGERNDDEGNDEYEK